MCGIVGFTTKEWIAPEGRIRDAAMTLIHRGPDQQGVHRSLLCSLGAARLKILDLAAGDQPIYSEDRDTVIVFNGEIYNHLELRKELEARGHRFVTHCDTETVLHAFMEWDVECFARLRGMFGVALWQQSRHRLVLARDRMGIKPLYVARRGEDLLFASELKGILIHPEFERRLSLQGLDCYLSMNYVPAPWTLVEGIEKLAPGHWLEWRDGRTETQPYWRIPSMQPGKISQPEAEAELDRLLRQSVSEHLLSDVPLGVWLSGGVDSTTMLHYAAEASGSKLRTYSISFKGHSFDESAYIREVVEKYGTIHEQLDLNPEQDLEGAIRELTYYSDEPSADSGALPVWFLSKLCRKSCTVAFSGEGADEIFGGYLTYRANRIAQQVRHLPQGVIRAAQRAMQAWPASNEKISFEYKVKRMLQGSLLAPEQAHVYWNGTFSELEKAALVRQPLPGAMPWLLSGLRAEIPGDGIAPYLKFDQECYLPDDILVKSDRMSMAHSIEVRPPFLDHRLVEFAAGLPSALKIRGSRQKYLLKQLMQSKLPPSILRRKKIGFDIPAHEWFRGPLKGVLMDALEGAEAEHGDLFCFDKIYELTQQHMNRSINLGFHLWGLMVLFLWMRQWKIQSAPAQQLSPAFAALGE
ncbi:MULTISPECIES: asparagine synthase (glutamine-hydrolyzing) [Acidobacterium]|uniref:asparagine synthase (glutamine-hydrolyzing) n=1 Tax=Acidobacterium capsulatum (strain ATCC 51196 / DSM 11244 / BCRC 80197 / JCM 7670 / NBRC 15755 / NCIMB 13165 / 161) TaxID=240015 RepID=C1F418_ACIC5|nr:MULTISPECIES: asparagine synthase (glutamine-hydrolyzing) [Acidobacterium]ACO33771.1 asparagine synthase [Acidobacterium capsulatum ATCC 51196]